MNARNWKWMMPGVGFSAALLLTRGLLFSAFEWVRWCAVISGGVMVMCAVACVGGLIDYRRMMAVEALERKQNALGRTPLSAELEAARGVHPDTVRLILNERHRVWALRNGNLEKGVRAYDVLYHAPEVTIHFLDYFLRSSTEQMVMPKRLLVEGRKNRFDPFGAVDEYTMYDRLIGLLVSQGKLVKWAEYMPYEWIAPWGPRTVAEEWGLVWDEEVAEVSEVSKVSDVRV